LIRYWSVTADPNRLWVAVGDVELEVDQGDVGELRVGLVHLEVEGPRGEAQVGDGVVGVGGGPGRVESELQRVLELGLDQVLVVGIHEPAAGGSFA
jgi:hypothetical protein